MERIKSYTDIEQSRKLEKILPLESADMCYRPYREEGGISDYQADLCPHRFASWIGIPCWSLAALLDVLPNDCFVHKEEEGKFVAFYLTSGECGSYVKTNPIDACYEMILELHELKML